MLRDGLGEGNDPGLGLSELRALIRGDGEGWAEGATGARDVDTSGRVTGGSKMPEKVHDGLRREAERLADSDRVGVVVPDADEVGVSLVVVELETLGLNREGVGDADSVRIIGLTELEGEARVTDEVFDKEEELVGVGVIEPVAERLGVPVIEGVGLLVKVAVAEGLLEGLGVAVPVTLLEGVPVKEALDDELDVTDTVGVLELLLVGVADPLSVTEALLEVELEGVGVLESLLVMEDDGVGVIDEVVEALPLDDCV